jgi:hypothetical protein
LLFSNPTKALEEIYLLNSIWRAGFGAISNTFPTLILPVLGGFPKQE